MWLLPTHKSPDALAAFVTAARATGMSEPCLVFIDGDPAGYRHVDLPENMWMLFGGKRRELCAVLNEFAGRWPREDYYGLVCDDSVPETPGWDTALADAAGRSRFVSCEDRRNRTDIPWEKRVVCFGGDVIRTMGFWALPGLVHLYVDDVWRDIAEGLGNHVHRDDIVVRNLMAEHSGGRMLNGHSYADDDKQRYRDWATDEKNKLIARLRAELRVAA